MRKIHFLATLTAGAAIFAGAVLLTGSFQDVAGQQTSPTARVPIGAVAAQAAGRVHVGPDGTTDIFGYFTFVEGMPGLFKGAPAASGAHLTYRAEPTSAQFVENGRVLHLIAAPTNGQFSRIGVYYQADPQRDLDRGDSFSDGTHVASFRTHGTRANVTSNAYFLATTLELEWAIDFRHQDRTVNLRSLGDSATLQSFGPGAQLDALIDQVGREGRVTVDYGATAFAAGAYPLPGQ
ncbi:MAG: hypothetical protein R2762_17855 [Bryobacteraceae bacterium]